MFDEQQFLETLAKMFRTDASALTVDTLVREDLGATSQTLFAVSALLEKMSGKKVNYADVNVCNTLGDIIALVK